MKNQYQYAIKFSLLTLLILFHLPSPASNTNVLFEGYYKLSLQETPIGYIINRMEFNKKKNQFISKQYVRMKTATGVTQESSVTVSSQKFQPLSYRYTSQSKQATRLIEGKIRNQKLELTISDGKTATTKITPLKNSPFFSSILAYIMLNKGIAEGKNFKYFAISEENGKVVEGKAYVRKKIKTQGIEAFEIFNEYDKLKFISAMSGKGEVFNTKLPKQHLKIELVATPSRAVLNHTLPSKTLMTLFGEVPSGKVNAFARRLTKSKTPPPKGQ